MSLIAPGLALSQDSTLGILLLKSPNYSQLDLFDVADKVRQENEQSLVVGSLMHEAMAGVIAGMGVLMLLLRSVDTAVAKKILFAFAVAMTVSLAGALRHYMMPEITPPVPALGLQAVMIGVAYYVSLKGKED